DVDVGLVDRPVDGQEVERPEGPDLVDAAGDSAAAEDQRGARPASPPASRLRALRLPLPGLLELYNRPHGQGSSMAAGPAAGALLGGNERVRRPLNAH